MINGKSDNEYWESLVEEPKESSATLRTVAQTLGRDGEAELAIEYNKRAEVIERHEQLILSLGRLDKTSLNEQMWRMSGPRIAGMLIWQGWTPPAALFLTDFGRKVVSNTDRRSQK